MYNHTISSFVIGPSGQSGWGFPFRMLATSRHSVARLMLSHAHDTPTPFPHLTVYYPNVTTLRSGLFCRKSVCLSSVVCLSVCL